MKEFEKKVRFKIEELGLKFNTFCGKVGMSDVAMRKIFQRNDCKVEDLIRISEVLNVPVMFFLEDTQISNVSNRNIDECNKEVEFMKMQIKYMQDVIDSKEELLQNYRSQISIIQNKVS